MIETIALALGAVLWALLIAGGILFMVISPGVFLYHRLIKRDAKTYPNSRGHKVRIDSVSYGTKRHKLATIGYAMVRVYIVVAILCIIFAAIWGFVTVPGLVLGVMFV